MHVTQQPVWSSMPGRVWDTDIWVGCPDNLEQALKWRPKVPFEVGLARTVEWLQDIIPLTFYASRVFPATAGGGGALRLKALSKPQSVRYRVS